jgi:hypothetical protein
MLGAAAVMGIAGLVERFGPRLAFHRWYGAMPGPEGAPFVVGTTGYRAGSFLYDPLITGFYFAGLVAWSAAIAVYRSRWRPLAVVGFGICVAGDIVTGTRTGFVGGGIGVFVALALSLRNPRIRFSLIGLGVVVAGSLWLFYAAAGSPTLVRPESDKGHQARLERDVELLSRRPFGYGLGTTDRFSYRANAGPGQLGPTESTYLSIALESGFHGLALYMTALFVTGMRLRKVRRKAREARDQAPAVLAAGAMGAMVAVVTAGLFLGVHELPIELVIWGPAALALAWPLKTSQPAEAWR